VLEPGPGAAAAWARLVDLFRAAELVPDKDGATRVDLDAHGHRWFRAEWGRP
jgi:hypothetical protein